MRFIACCMFILRRVNVCYCMLHVYFETCQCVLLHVALTRLYRISCSRSHFLSPKKALGIGAASFASFSGAGCGDGSGIWERVRERDFRAGTGFGSGWGLSEQRYSGKPDGAAGTPKSINKQKKSPSLTTLLSEWPDSNGRPLAPHARMLADCTTPR